MSGDGGEISQDWRKFKWIPSENVREYQNRLTPLGYEGPLPLFICRSKYRGHYYHGKFIFGYGGYISGDGKEHDVGRGANSKYEVLFTPINSVKWVATSGRHIPEWAVAAGTDANKSEITYVGRAQHGEFKVIGRIVKSDGVCYYPYDRKEHYKGNYEVLVLTEEGRKLASAAAIL